MLKNVLRRKLLGRLMVGMQPDGLPSTCLTDPRAPTFATDLDPNARTPPYIGEGLPSAGSSHWICSTHTAASSVATGIPAAFISSTAFPRLAAPGAKR